MILRTESSRPSFGSKCRQSVWLLLSLVIFCTSVFAAPPSSGSFDVAINNRETHGPLSSVYVALVSLDQPAYRPTVEAVVDGTVKWDGIAAGRYVLLTEAPGFHPVTRNVEITDGKSGHLSVELQPEFELTGNVVDAAGRPVKNATISHPRITPPTLSGVMSDLARQHATHLRTTTDDNGWWKLGVPVKEFSLLVEAPGYEPAWVSFDPKQSPMPPVKLQPGSSLRIVTNRPAPDVVLTLVPSTRIETSVPFDWRDRVWARDAGTTSVEWKSMPAGEYDLVASWPDPKQFTAPKTLRHVSLKANGNEEIKVALPDAPPVTPKNVRILVPFKTDLRGLRAFLRTSGGVTEVPAAPENVMGGRLLYANADPASEVFFTTDADVILPARPADGSQNPGKTSVIQGIKIARADGALKVSVPENTALPSQGNARFEQCAGDHTASSFVLPVNVKKGGDVTLPVLVGCHALSFHFGSFSPVVVRPTAHARERVWFGAHLLKSAASVQVHVTHKSDGSNAPEAMVTASVARGSESLIVGKGTARADGWLSIEGLPAGEEITFRAQDATKIVGSVARTLDPGKREVIDPLQLPEAGTLTVAPRFEDNFKNENAKAQIIAVVVQPAEKIGQADMRTVDLNSNQEALFAGLNPGSWRVLATVQLDGPIQPIYVDTVTIEAGDKKKIDPVIEPLIIAGHLTSHGHGVIASIAFTDPPGPGAISRRVMSKEDGAFKTLLPHAGSYGIAARRKLADPDSELAPIQFNQSERDVRIELPEGSLSVRVFAGGSPAADAQITASMLGDSQQQNQILRLERKARTDSIGEVMLDDMQEGTWLVRARGKDETVAEKTITLAATTPGSITLNLDDGSVLEGTVVDSAGNPSAIATVNCIYTGNDHIPRTGAAETDSWGKFTIHFPKPAPERLQCGVAAADGAIGAFITAPTSDARLALPPATGVVTFTNWSDRGNRDRFWLIGADGGIFDLSWAALKYRKLDGPFTIPKMPAGTWSVVRIDSAGAFDALAGGGTAGLPKVTQVRFGAGEHKEISMKSGDTIASR
jgi:hypothetical protein